MVEHPVYNMFVFVRLISNIGIFHSHYIHYYVKETFQAVGILNWEMAVIPPCIYNNQIKITS